MLDDRIIALELKKALIEVLPEVMEAAMKPVEKIKDIRIVDMGGGNPGLRRRRQRHGQRRLAGRPAAVAAACRTTSSRR